MSNLDTIWNNYFHQDAMQKQASYQPQPQDQFTREQEEALNKMALAATDDFYEEDILDKQASETAGRVYAQYLVAGYKQAAAEDSSGMKTDGAAGNTVRTQAQQKQNPTPPGKGLDEEMMKRFLNKAEGSAAPGKVMSSQMGTAPRQVKVNPEQAI